MTFLQTSYCCLLLPVHLLLRIPTHSWHLFHMGYLMRHVAVAGVLLSLTHLLGRISLSFYILVLGSYVLLKKPLCDGAQALVSCYTDPMQIARDLIETTTLHR